MGRTSILMVLTFNVLFMVVGFRISSLASSAYNKYLTYYSVEQASLAAESGANIAISNAYFARATAFPSASFSSGSGINGTIKITKVAIQTVSTDTIGFVLTSTASDDNSTVITTVTCKVKVFLNLVCLLQLKAVSYGKQEIHALVLTTHRIILIVPGRRGSLARRQQMVVL